MDKLSTRIAGVGLASLLFATSLSTSAEIAFNAVVSYPTENSGVYSFTTEKYDPQLIKRDVYASGGGIAYDDGYFYGVRVETVMGITAVAQNSYKMSTWEVEDNFTGKVTDVATANTFDVDLGQAYGCYFNEDGETFRFCSVNVPYFATTKIAELPKGWGACGFNKDGVLYAVDEDGMLLTVSTENGAITEVGDTGLKTDWITGGMVDKESNTMLYAIKTDAETALYSIDLASAKATKLYDLANEEQLGGFFVPEKEYAPAAPGKGYTKPSLSISGTAMSGKLAFYTPTNTVDGTKGTGDITYHIYANGKEIANGTTSFGGTRLSVDVAVDKAGTYCFAVSFSNESGEGPRQRGDAKYIGADTPKAPVSLTVAYADGKSTLRWGSVTSGVHGGSIDTANRTYRVTRYPDATVVSADNLNTTSMVDELPTPDKRTTYWYTVEAVAGGLVSPATKSASFELGPIEPPYETNFASANDFIGYSSLANDNKAWSYDTYEHEVKVSTSAKPADNWLLLPPVEVKAGMSYEFVLAARSYGSSYTEEFEVCAGPSPEAAALTQTVIAKTSVTGSTYTQFKGTAVADATGKLYIGVHATTPTNGGYLYINYIKIGAGVSDRTPAAPADLSAAADPNGRHTATITFTAPATTIGGSPLDAIVRTELFRDGELVKTVTEGITPGQPATIIDDTDPSAGKHIYKVVCHNTLGAGAEASAETFIGFSAPLAPASVTMREPSNGHVAASWAAVSSDIDGRTLGKGDVTYNVYKYLAGEKYTVATGVEGTSIAFDAFDEFEDFDGQRFVQTLVEAVTEGGTSKIQPSAQTAVGVPYTAPWSESFADCKIQSIFANQIVSGDDVWKLVAADDFGVTPADNDGGMMYLEAYGRGACSLLTGKIDLADVVEPAFIFQVFHYASSSPNENVVEVEVRADGDYEKVFSSKIMDLGAEAQWCKATVPLADFAGQVVEMRITAYNNTFAFTHLDDFKINSIAPYNLSLISLSYPATVSPNTDFTVKADIENLGTERALGYKVNLVLDGHIAATENGTALESGEKTSVTFTQRFDVLNVGEHEYEVEVEYGPDMFVNDNTRDFSIVVESNSLPVVSDLAVSYAGNAVALKWSEPKDLTVATASTENFDAPSLSWATSVSGWTFVDKDGGTIGGIGNRQLPVTGRQSFFVFDNTLAALQTGNVSAFNAHSGNQYLCSMYSAIGGKPVANDDWAISPELTGEAQTISLWATSFPCDPDQPQYYETFQILYSMSGTATDDFTLVAEYTNIPQQWKEYTAYIPEGAKYFAIRCVSQYQYMLFVDDVTFRAKNGATATANVKGYNVYRDGERITEAPVETTVYADAEANADVAHTYVVTALYAEGESLKSNEAVYDPAMSGLTGMESSSVEIFTAHGAIVVTGAEDCLVEVFAADGKCVAKLIGAPRTSIPAENGFYIVKVGDTVAKVAVK